MPDPAYPLLFFSFSHSFLILPHIVYQISGWQVDSCSGPYVKESLDRTLTTKLLLVGRLALGCQTPQTFFLSHCGLLYVEHVELLTRYQGIHVNMGLESKYCTSNLFIYSYCKYHKAYQCNVFMALV